MVVEAYLQRIKLDKIDSVNLEYLQKLQRNHLLNIPFENLDIHIDRPIVLDVEKILKKILHKNRGGFCYELNGIFCELLIELGYKAHYISASVYSKENGFGPELDHMAILVQLENQEYLVDVGFGRFTLEPLKFVIREVQIDEHGIFIIDQLSENEFCVYKHIDGERITQYKFQKTRCKLEDFEEQSQFNQTSPESHFTHKMVISKPTSDGRITLNNTSLKITRDSKKDRLIEFQESEFNDYLKRYFDIVL